jgi:hypothetical protein
MCAADSYQCFSVTAITRPTRRSDPRHGRSSSPPVEQAQRRHLDNGDQPGQLHHRRCSVIWVERVAAGALDISDGVVLLVEGGLKARQSVAGESRLLRLRRTAPDAQTTLSGLLAGF